MALDSQCRKGGEVLHICPKVWLKIRVGTAGLYAHAVGNVAVKSLSAVNMMPSVAHKSYISYLPGSPETRKTVSYAGTRMQAWAAVLLLQATLSICTVANEMH